MASNKCYDPGRQRLVLVEHGRRYWHPARHAMPGRLSACLPQPPDQLTTGLGAQPPSCVRSTSHLRHQAPWPCQAVTTIVQKITTISASKHASHPNGNRATYKEPSSHIRSSNQKCVRTAQTEAPSKPSSPIREDKEVHHRRSL